jgi:hypothetical protein
MIMLSLQLTEPRGTMYGVWCTVSMGSRLYGPPYRQCASRFHNQDNNNNRCVLERYVTEHRQAFSTVLRKSRILRGHGLEIANLSRVDIGRGIVLIVRETLDDINAQTSLHTPRNFMVIHSPKHKHNTMS